MSASNNSSDEFNYRDVVKIEFYHGLFHTWDEAARARGFHCFLVADEYYWLKGCTDTNENRTALITIMCNALFDRLDNISSSGYSECDLTLIHINVESDKFLLLFHECMAPESYPVCLAIWDRNNQEWLARLE
jgi:hypothetical protein